MSFEKRTTPSTQRDSDEYDLLPGNFKRSLSVGEKMKTPSKIEGFIQILSSEDEKPQLLFDNQEKELALDFFKYNNYYNFSIFPKLLPESNANYSFSDTIFLYTIDEFLRKEINYFTSRIEKLIKTSLAYNLSHMYSGDDFVKAECYLDPNLYTSEERYEEILINFSETLKESKEPFIKHHYQKRNGCIPIWVLIEELTFGQVDTFISCLNADYKNDWADIVFGRDNRKFIYSWIPVCRYLRNISAHHGRFYGKTFIVLPKLKKEDMKANNIKQNSKNTLFVALLVLKSMLSFQTVQVIQEWNSFINELDKLLNDKPKVIDYNIIGFSDNWKNSLLI